ncbi:MAG TPA: hypothetical protein VK358_17280 [Longimicrobium sp.]|nr:hypothetical protein [Longimicrobium sp.]
MPPTPSSVSIPSLKEQLVRESSAMVRQLVGNGIRVPPAVIHAADQFETALEQKKPIDVIALAGTHERLARLVAPAKPGTLYLLDANAQQRGDEAGFTSPLRIVRHMIRVAIACVGVFIILSVLSLAEAHDDIRLFSNEYLIVKVILDRVFWLAAAGIGAAFAMLFQLNDQVTSRTFDPDESSSYWVKFYLGVVAGFILVALIPESVTGSTEVAGGGDGTSAQALARPTIALLGGFSASAVYRILTRMVEALESVFSGGAREQAAAAEKAAASRASEESAQSRMAVAGQLVDLQQKLAAGMKPEDAAAQMRSVVAALVPSSLEFGGADAGAAAGASRPPSDAPEKVPALAIVADPADAPSTAASTASAPVSAAASDAGTEPSPDAAAPSPAPVG